MTAFATLVQFTDRFERALKLGEESRVTALLDDASAIIRSAVPAITDPAPAIVVGTACAMVARVLRNPEGKFREAFGDDYDFQRDAAQASGELVLTETERDNIAAAVVPGSASRAFSIAPLYPAEEEE